MKPRHQRKLFRLVREDDLPKLKSFIKKHHLDALAARDESRDESRDDTLLHAACSCGHDAIVWSVYITKITLQYVVVCCLAVPDTQDAVPGGVVILIDSDWLRTSDSV